MSPLSKSTDDLLPMAYEHLCALAAEYLAKEGPASSLEPEELVHEAFLRITHYRCSENWWGREAFLAAAGEAMRRILIDDARKRTSIKFGGKVQRKPWHESLVSTTQSPIALFELKDLLSDFERQNELAAELVKLRVFGGFTHEEAALILKIKRRTADRLWSFARNWFSRRLRAD